MTANSRNRKNMLGMKIGRLLVIQSAPTANGKAVWKCLCDCGKNVITTGERLRNGDTTSCGCFNREKQKILHLIHGHNPHGNPTRTYRAWVNMKSRCQAPTSNRWNYYGGRGIKVCDRWMTFNNFLLDMGECPEGFTIERKDNNKGYCPENCRWATPREQAENKSNTLRVTHNGETLPIARWAERIGLKYTTLRCRIKTGKMTISESLTEPLRVW